MPKRRVNRGAPLVPVRIDGDGWTGWVSAHRDDVHNHHLLGPDERCECDMFIPTKPPRPLTQSTSRKEQTQTMNHSVSQVVPNARTVMSDLQRGKAHASELGSTLDDAIKVFDALVNKLYERDRYVEALEARLVELQTQPQPEAGTLTIPANIVYTFPEDHPIVTTLREMYEVQANTDEGGEREVAAWYYLEQLESILGVNLHQELDGDDNE